MQAIKKYASKEALTNQDRVPHDEELGQFSEAAQKNIRQIQSRINQIQSILKAEK